LGQLAFEFEVVEDETMSDFLKCECPHCGLHIEFAKADAGRETECPQCRQPVQLLVPMASTSPPQRWIILDTETDGLAAPIHVVEIAAQLMEGWEVCGEPFQVFLNHDIPIPIEAIAIHGYTREFLREHGLPPREAHEKFRAYVGTLPITSHNLRFDWDSALVPEWRSLSIGDKLIKGQAEFIPKIGQRGFCLKELAKRLVCESPGFSLDRLRDVFQITVEDRHRALGDVRSLVDLFQRIYRPRLERACAYTFDAWAIFSIATPIEKCLATALTPQEISEGIQQREQFKKELQDKTITILAKSSSGGSYKVTFTADNPSMRVSCDCPSGVRHWVCYHKIALIRGDRNMLFNVSQSGLLDKVCSLRQFKELKSRVEAYCRELEKIDTPSGTEYEVYEKSFAERKALKQYLAAGMSVGFRYLTGDQIVVALAQEHLAACQKPTPQQMESLLQQETKFLEELGFTAEDLSEFESPGHLIGRILRPIDYALARTFKNRFEILEENMRSLQIALAHWDYCPHLPRYGPHAMWKDLNAGPNDPHRDLMKAEKMAVLDLAAQVLPAEVFLLLKSNGLQYYKIPLDERIRNAAKVPDYQVLPTHGRGQ
jgi:DNA polymerase-3 subunit epsilon